MEKNSFLKNSIVLTMANITTGILGFIFSIYLSKLIGPEGIGLYGLVMPIYNLFICLMTAGIIAAISQTSAIFKAKGEYNNIYKTIKKVASFNIIWAVVIGITVYFAAPFISTYGIHDIRAIDAIKVTCPAMVFISLSNILKGYFYGVSKITIPSFIDILEKALRIIIISLLIFFFKATTITELVTLAYISLALGELQSLLLLFIYYLYLKKKKLQPNNTRTERTSQLLFNVFVIALPLCLNGFLGNLFGTVSTLLLPRRLGVAGFSYSEALSLIGKFNGMALTIVTFPIIVIGSINALIIPDLSETLSRGDVYNAIIRIKKVIKLAFLLGLATLVICNILPNDLGYMFYERDDLGNYIKLISLSAPIIFTAQTMFGFLNGLGKQGVILRNSLIVSAVELICLFVLVGNSKLNILGYGISIFITSTLSLIINLREVKKHIDLNFSLTNIFIYLLLSMLIFLVMRLLSNVLFPSYSIFKNLFVVILTFLTFAGLSFLGVEEDY